MFYVSWIRSNNTRSGLTACDTQQEALALADLLPPESEPLVQILCNKHGFSDVINGDCAECYCFDDDEDYSEAPSLNKQSHVCNQLCGYFDCHEVEADPEGCYERLVS